MRQEGNKRSAAMIALSAASEAALPFVRSVVLAHLISPEQFGLAITLALAAGTSELITDIGVANSAMRQGERGRDDNVLPTLHTILLARAVVIGLILAVSGFPLAYLFGVPEAALSFSMLGLAAFIRGFHHLEPARVLRDFVYGPDAITNSLGHVVWSAVTIAAAFVFDDYRCMLLGIIAGAIVYVVATHLFSRERWRLGWDREVAREALAYGAPLIPNGIALAVASMGDRFLIGSFLGLAPMAYYNASSTAAFMPRSVIMRMLGAVTLPTFLRLGRQGIVTSRLIDYYGIALSGISSLYSATFLCFGAWAIGLVFGERYTPDQALVSAIALSVYMKYLTSLPTLPALVFGQTKLVLTSTVLSSLSLACAAGAVLVSPTLPSFVFGIALGEFLTVLWSVVVSIKIYGLARRLAWFNVLFPLSIGAVAHFVTMAVPIGALGTRIEIYLVALVALAIGYAAAFKVSRLPWLAECVRIMRSAPKVTVQENAI